MLHFYLQSYAFILSFILESQLTITLEGRTVDLTLGPYRRVLAQGSTVESHLRVPSKGPGYWVLGTTFPVGRFHRVVQGQLSQ